MKAPKTLLSRGVRVLRRPPVWIPMMVVLLVVGYFWFRREVAVDASTTTYAVRRGPFTVSIVEPGNLSAVNEVSVRSEVEGTARIIFIVPEGSFVKKGDLLVELDSAAAQDQVNLQQINYEKARFGLIQAQEQLAIQSNTVASDISATELKLEFARLDLERYDQGQRVADLVEASNKMVQAESQLAVNLETYRWTTNLASKGYETQQRVDADRLSVLNNRNSLIVASNALWLLKEFDIRKQRQQFESSLMEASNELVRVQAQARARIAQSVADLLTQSNTLALNKRKLERDLNNLEATKIHAPQDGLVVYSVNDNRWSNESLIEEGATVRNRQELIKLPDTSRMKVTVKVHESHVNMMRTGLPAYVVLESMPDEHFAGNVHRVGLLPDTQARWGNPNLKVYNTDIYITDPLPDVKPGVSAMAEIIITNMADTLFVPIQAVTTLKGRQVVYVAKGGDPEPRPVDVGMYNTKFIQILSGVSEGERVLLAPPFDTHEKDIGGEVLSPDEKSKVRVTNALPARPAAPERPPKDRGPEPETTSVPAHAPSFAASAHAGPPGESVTATAATDLSATPATPAVAAHPEPGAEDGSGANGGRRMRRLQKDGDEGSSKGRNSVTMQESAGPDDGAGRRGGAREGDASRRPRPAPGAAVPADASNG